MDNIYIYIYIYKYHLSHRNCGITPGLYDRILIYMKFWSSYSHYVYFFFDHITCKSTCDTLPSSAANQGDNTVLLAQGGTATPGATNKLLPPVRESKEL